MDNRSMEMILTTAFGIFALILILLVAIPYFMGVSADIKYYKMEIKRSTSEKSKKYWKRKLRRFILEQIPLANLFIRKRK